jgi:DNA-binding NtrC family response regulator
MDMYPNSNPMQHLGTSILVVDDDAGTRGALKNALADEGYAVETAANGDEAWEYLGEHEADVVISDVRMRNGDGLSLLDKVRSNKPENPLFFLMSGYSDVSPSEAIAHGANAYFHKPCWLSDMLDAIEDALGNRG